jgi:hypothetical protein
MGKVSVKNELSSRPKRTRISCHASLERTAYAPLRKERRMKSAEATNFHRKSGVAKWRDLRFPLPSIKCLRGKRFVHQEHPDLPAASCESNEQHPRAIGTITSN